MGPGPINQGQHTFSPSFVICGEQSNTTPCAGLTKKSDFSPEAGSAEDIRERRGGGLVLLVGATLPSIDTKLINRRGCFISHPQVPHPPRRR